MKMKDQKESKGIFDEEYKLPSSKSTPEEDYKWNIRIPLILSIIPVIIHIYCLIKCEGNFSESGSGSVWIMFYGYILLLD